MPDRGDHALVIALAEARDSSLADAVARRHAWQERIGAALSGDSFSTFWSAFWTAVDALDRPASDHAASVGVLLLVSCRHIYASGRAFAQPHPVAPRLLAVARLVIDGFNAARLPFTSDIEHEIRDGVSRSIRENLAAHAEQFVTVVGLMPWTFDGGYMTFDVVARVYVGDLLPRIQTSTGFESLRQVFLRAADPHSSSAFKAVIAPHIARAWPQVRDELRATWVQRVERIVDRSEERGSGFVELFGPARADADWLTEARRGVEDALHGHSRHGLSSEARTRLTRWCEQLTHFDGALDGGRTLSTSSGIGRLTRTR